MEAIQSLLETSGAETRSKVEVKDLDKSVYFDADKEEEPLTSSPVKPAKKDEILDWIDERVNKAIESGSQTSNSKRSVPSKARKLPSKYGSGRSRPSKKGVGKTNQPSDCWPNNAKIVS